MQRFENNLSEGNVVTQLLKFSIPFLISNLIQTLYSVADMMIVGQFADTASMSGVNNGSQLQMTVTNLIMGFTVGGTVLVAQYLGRGDRQKIKETIGTLFSALAIAAVGITTVMLFTMDWILNAMQTPTDALPEARNYFFVTTIGTVFIFGYNALSAVMRGMGDSKNPLYFVAIACTTNIVLDLLFVGAFQWRAAGAAIATVISQALSMFLCIFYLKRHDFIFDFKLSSFRFHKDQLKLLFRVGIPTAIQNAVTSLSFLFLATLANSINLAASAAVGAAGKLNSFGILPAGAISASVSAMSAQNLGAGETGRALKTLRVGMLFSFAISFVSFLVMRSFPEFLLRAFGDDPEVIKYGAEYLMAFSFDYLLVPFVFCLNGLFIGAGHTTFSLFNSATSSLFFRIPACLLFSSVLGWDVFGLGLGAPVASAACLIIGLIFLASGRWKKVVIAKAID